MPRKASGGKRLYSKIKRTQPLTDEEWDRLDEIILGFDGENLESVKFDDESDIIWVTFPSKPVIRDVNDTGTKSLAVLKEEGVWSSIVTDNPEDVEWYTNNPGALVGVVGKLIEKTVTKNDETRTYLNIVGYRGFMLVPEDGESVVI